MVLPKTLPAESAKERHCTPALIALAYIYFLHPTVDYVSWQNQSPLLLKVLKKEGALSKARTPHTQQQPLS